MTEIIDAEVVDEPGTALEIRPEGTLFRTEDPAEFLVKATATATALAQAVRKQNLIVKIGNGEHAKVEAWTMLGSLLGVFPVCVWSRKLEDGWEARVEARTLSGQIVGAAEAECLRSESLWKNRDDYALRSMAQTRATSKALRQPLGFVMTLAGFDATPFEEMPSAADKEAEPKRGRGGLSPSQKKLYAAFKEREDAGKLTQADLKEFLKSTGAADLAHATDEQAAQALAFVEDTDTPFDADKADDGEFAGEHQIPEFLDLAKKVSPEAHEKAVAGLAREREAHGGRVRSAWLGRQSGLLLAKVAA